MTSIARTPAPNPRGPDPQPPRNTRGVAGVLALRGVDAADIRAILRRAAAYADAAPGADTTHPALRRRPVANLFFEDSTRTRLSFSIAAARLGAAPLDLHAAGSSVSKGETLIDTARTVEAMGVAAMIVRHRCAGAAAAVASRVACPVINAGDGRHEHPTQGLLDALTFAQAHGREDGFDFSGLTVAIVGDALHSRVARSDAAAFTALGARVVLAGPPALAPPALARALGCESTHDLDEALGAADAVQMLRIQFERLADTGAIAGPEAYARAWQLTPERAARMKRAAIVMHPGPMNRGVEIHPDVADGPSSRVLRQVDNGVPVRMATLAMCAEAAADHA
ncbi:MAG: aspartate carbamoyltransferase catalytic subunit [Phycisphaerales bacterium]|nr:MAG: aspartate carbamoyltransferase catalytic subunit [Phycisphaerales bacterium]